MESGEIHDYGLCADCGVRIGVPSSWTGDGIASWHWTSKIATNGVGGGWAHGNWDTPCMERPHRITASRPYFGFQSI